MDAESRPFLRLHRAALPGTQLARRVLQGSEESMTASEDRSASAPCRNPTAVAFGQRG